MRAGRRNAAAVTLQRIMLAHRGRRVWKAKLHATMRLQGLYWGVLVRRRIRYQQKRALQIQRMVVRWLSRRGVGSPRRPHLEYWIFQAMPSTSAYVVVRPLLRDIVTTAIAIGRSHVTGTCLELVQGRRPRHYQPIVLSRGPGVSHRESLLEGFWPYYAWLQERRDICAVKIQALQRGKMGRRRAYFIRTEKERQAALCVVTFLCGGNPIVTVLKMSKRRLKELRDIAIEKARKDEAARG